MSPSSAMNPRSRRDLYEMCKFVSIKGGEVHQARTKMIRGRPAGGSRHPLREL
jgi:hypothetical protein